MEMKRNPGRRAAKLSNLDFIRILCIENNRSLSKAIKAALACHGFNVVAARQGSDGLRKFKARSGKFGAIVIEDRMPQMNGLQFVRSVRKQGFKGPIFLISGNLSPEDLKAYYSQGIAGFLKKPFRIETLAPLVEISLLASLIVKKDQSIV
jgi:DNA-binding response OmpR family regulator